MKDTKQVSPPLNQRNVGVMGHAGRCFLLWFYTVLFLMKLDVLENNEDADQPGRKRARMDISQEATIKVAS